MAFYLWLGVALTKIAPRYALLIMHETGAVRRVVKDKPAGPKSGR